METNTESLIHLFQTGYAALAFLAFVMLVSYVLVKKKELNRNSLMISISIFVVNFGYYLISVSNNLTMALWANRIAYLGDVCLLVFTMQLIASLCNLSLQKLRIVYMAISVLVLLLALTGGTSIQWYYTSVDVKMIDGVAVLVKEYGPLHRVYFYYLICSLLIMVFMLVYSFFVKKHKENVNQTSITIIVALNLIVWGFEQAFHSYFEFLSVSYVVSEALFIIIDKNMRYYEETKKRLNQVQNKEENIIQSWLEKYQLTQREFEILQFLIQNEKRNEIAAKLFISENTVKKHTANIYDKLGVTTRSELLHKYSNELEK